MKKLTDRFSGLVNGVQQDLTEFSDGMIFLEQILTYFKKLDLIFLDILKNGEENDKMFNLRRDFICKISVL